MRFWKWLRPLSSWCIWFPKLSQQTKSQAFECTKYLVKTPQVCPFQILFRHTSFKFHPKWGQHPNIFIHPTPNLPDFLFNIFLCIATAGRLLSVRNHISCPRETWEPKKEQAVNLENPIIAKVAINWDISLTVYNISCYQLGYISYIIYSIPYRKETFWTRQHTSATGGVFQATWATFKNPCDTHWLLPRDPYIWLSKNPYITT